MFSRERKFVIDILKNGILKNTSDVLRNLIFLPNKNLTEKIQLTE